LMSRQNQVLLLRLKVQNSDCSIATAISYVVGVMTKLNICDYSRLFNQISCAIIYILTNCVAFDKCTVSIFDATLAEE